MAKRSLKASEAGQIKAKQAFERTGWTQEHLANQVGLGTRQSVWKFFTGRPVDRSIFVDLCFQLDLAWEEIVDQPIVKPKVRSAKSSVTTIKEQLHDTLKASLSPPTIPFDICQSLPLNKLYTPQFFLPALSSQRWLDLHELAPIKRGAPKAEMAENSKHLAAQFTLNQQKLVILGNPGSGKTTLLHHIALQCLDNRLYADNIPVFISLRSFVVQHPNQQFPALEDYLRAQLPPIFGMKMPVSEFLKDGRFLILMDGLDEVSLQAMPALCQTLQQWVQTYGNNRYILTCRTAARQYVFNGFTYTELAEFSPEQIEQFVQKFFQSVGETALAGEHKARDFLEQLYRKPNQPIRDLVTTPILLNLVCSIFQARKTLPANRAKLYQAALDILMERWDQARGIDRNGTGSLPLSKVDRLKLLSYLAAQTFEKGKFFFDKQDILAIISEYWGHLKSEPSLDTESLWAQAEQVIQAIAAHNGLLVERAKDIYAFSHLTFHEYLTARNIIATPQPQGLEQRLQTLTTKVNQYHWREVICLTANLLPEPLTFLEMLQQNILKIVIEYQKIIQFLEMIQNKAEQLSLAYPKWVLRTFYFSTLINTEINTDFKSGFAVEPLLSNQLSPDLALDLTLIRLLNAMKKLQGKASMSHILELYSVLSFESQHMLDANFLAAVQMLKSELPQNLAGQRSQQDWWQKEGQQWMGRWREMIQQHRGLSLDWQWSQEESNILQTYYQANQYLSIVSNLKPGSPPQNAIR